MICEYAKKSNSQLVIIRKIGLPFIIKKYNKRWGILIGALFLCFVLIASQNFIWIIEFNGNKNLSQERLISQLSTIGIKKGAYIPAINFRDKQQEALIKMSELGWISFNRDGSKISVEISERVLAPEIMPQTPCNIIAKKTGQIKYMEIYNGECIKKLNDTVCDGDIIVKGETVNKKGG
ncbi:MAG: sporulation protein YqfD, partial [Oscillospiraceae bacterium]